MMLRTVFAPVTQAARALSDDPSGMQVNTRHVLILLDATTETRDLAETKVNHGCSHLS